MHIYICLQSVKYRWQSDLSSIPLNLPQIMPFNNVTSLSDLRKSFIHFYSFISSKVKFLFTATNNKNSVKNNKNAEEIENDDFFFLNG